MYKLGWFSTGRDKAARDLLTVAQRSIALGETPAEFAFVFCNREPGETKESDLFLKLVESYGVPLVCFSSRSFRADKGTGWRLEYDRKVMDTLENKMGFHPDLCVLAGYMLIVGKEMCQRYNMINLHPATPGGPKGTWQEVIWQLIESNADATGVMMHLVTPELDTGPPVSYCTFPIRGKPFDRYWRELEKLPINHSKRHDEKNSLFRLIRKHGLAREFPLIIATLKAFSQVKVKIEKGKVVDAAGSPIKGYNLSDEINQQIHLLRP